MIARKAAVIGLPITHSLSPVLHQAAFADLGLTGWTYDRVECAEDQVESLLRKLGPEWVGLSVTMPAKREALRLADSATERAQVVGAANTLVRIDQGWHADCTDIDGIINACQAVAGLRDGKTAVVLGAGGTALAALYALTELGIRSVTLVARDVQRAADAIACADRLSLDLTVNSWSTTDFSQLADSADVLISTAPASATAPIADELSNAPRGLDAIYHPWPTPLASAFQKRGKPVATGLDMLLYQAFGQVAHFTGLPAPRMAMWRALCVATGIDLARPVAE